MREHVRIIKVEQDVCPKCKVLDTMLYAIPEVNEKIEKLNLDHLTEEQVKEFGTREDIINKLDIMGTPTLLFFDENGLEIDRLVGVFPPDVILKKLEEL